MPTASSTDSRRDEQKLCNIINIVHSLDHTSFSANAKWRCLLAMRMMAGVKNFVWLTDRKCRSVDFHGHSLAGISIVGCALQSTCNCYMWQSKFNSNGMTLERQHRLGTYTDHLKCITVSHWVPGKTRLRNDLLCVEWDVKPYTLTQSLGVQFSCCCYFILQYCSFYLVYIQAHLLKFYSLLSWMNYILFLFCSWRWRQCLTENLVHIKKARRLMDSFLLNWVEGIG